MSPQTGQAAKYANKTCKVLDSTDNVKLIKLLGPKCISMAAGVVQVLQALDTSSPVWTKTAVGVVVFVRDASRKNYFFRVYDIMNSTVLFEQELYKEFSYHKLNASFVAFEAAKHIVGFNFADLTEAGDFKDVLDKHVNKQLDKSRHTVAPNKDPAPKLANSSSSAQTNIAQPPVRRESLPVANTTKLKKKKKDKPKLTKKSIGEPCDFVHLQSIHHDGQMVTLPWDLMNTTYKALLVKAGVSQVEFNNNKALREGVLDFVAQQSELHTTSKNGKPNRQLGEPPPPPPPRVAVKVPPVAPARPPAPSNRQPPAPPPNKPKSGPVSRTVPQPPPQRPSPSVRPPPSVPVGRVGPTRAPPPPPPSTSHPPPPPPPSVPHPPAFSCPPADATKGATPTSALSGRSALLDQIQQGRKLKTPSSDPPETGKGDGGARGDLLSAIRHGAKLKPVKNGQEPSRKPVEDPNKTAEGMSDLADLLARHIQKIKPSLMADSDCSDVSEESEWSD